MDKLVVKFAATTLDETVGYDIYKIFQDLFLPAEKRDNMLPEGIQSEDLCKIRSNAGTRKQQVSTPKKNLTSLRQQVSHKSRPSDPGRSRCFLSSSSLQ